MLISFNPSQDQLCLADLSDLELLFAELLRASARGYHFVVISREACDWALENLNLSGAQNAKLRSLRNQFTQIGGLQDEALCKLILNLDESGLIRDNGHHYTIGYKALLATEYLSSATGLVVEHTDTDGRLYCLIFDETKKTASIKNYSLNPVFGGGSGIVAALRAELSKKKITVCLCDSDKQAPRDANSATIRGLENEIEGSGALATVFQTICREAENHIPLEIIKSHNLCPDYPHYKCLERRMMRAQNLTDTPVAWHYFDVKEGFCGPKLAKKEFPDGVKAWIEFIYLEKGEAIEDILIAGFGKNLLSTFLSTGAAKADFHRFVRSKKWADSFQDYFAQLYWFFVSDKALASYPN